MCLPISPPLIRSPTLTPLPSPVISLTYQVKPSTGLTLLITSYEIQTRKFVISLLKKSTDYSVVTKVPEYIESKNLASKVGKDFFKGRKNGRIFLKKKIKKKEMEMWMTFPNMRKWKENLDNITKFKGGKKVSKNLSWKKPGFLTSRLMFLILLLKVCQRAANPTTRHNKSLIELGSWSQSVLKTWLFRH